MNNTSFDLSIKNLSKYGRLYSSHLTTLNKDPIYIWSFNWEDPVFEKLNNTIKDVIDLKRSGGVVAVNIVQDFSEDFDKSIGYLIIVNNSIFKTKCCEFIINREIANILLGNVDDPNWDRRNEQSNLEADLFAFDLDTDHIYKPFTIKDLLTVYYDQLNLFDYPISTKIAVNIDLVFRFLSPRLRNLSKRLRLI